MLGQNNVCGIRCAPISFVVVAIVPTSVGIRGTEVQFLAGTVVASFHSAAARRKKRSLKKRCQVQRALSRLLTASTPDYFDEIVILVVLARTANVPRRKYRQ